MTKTTRKARPRVSGESSIQAEAGGTPPADGMPPADGTPSAEAIRQAIEELGLNRPFYTCRIVGSRLEFSLYGGDLVYWPPKRARPRRGSSGRTRAHTA